MKAGRRREVFLLPPHTIEMQRKCLSTFILAPRVPSPTPFEISPYYIPQFHRYPLSFSFLFWAPNFFLSFFFIPHSNISFVYILYSFSISLSLSRSLPRTRSASIGTHPRRNAIPFSLRNSFFRIPISSL